VVHNQISFHSKTKDLCNIYGQTFTSINFGNASYSPNLSKFEHLGPLKNKSKNYAKGLSRNTNINADLLQPLLAISKDNLNENTISPKNNKESNNTDTALNTFSEELSNKTPAIKISKLNL
jgi:nitrate reductase alpha subunit